MNKQSIKKLFKEEYEHLRFPDQKNTVSDGFALLAKYSKDIRVAAAYRRIYAGLSDRELSRFKREDAMKLFELGWVWDDEMSNWSIGL